MGASVCLLLTESLVIGAPATFDHHGTLPTDWLHSLQPQKIESSTPTTGDCNVSHTQKTALKTLGQYCHFKVNENCHFLFFHIREQRLREVDAGSTPCSACLLERINQGYGLQRRSGTMECMRCQPSLGRRPCGPIAAVLNEVCGLMAIVL